MAEYSAAVTRLDDCLAAPFDAYSAAIMAVNTAEHKLTSAYHLRWFHFEATRHDRILRIRLDRLSIENQRDEHLHQFDIARIVLHTVEITSQMKLERSTERLLRLKARMKVRTNQGWRRILHARRLHQENRIRRNCAEYEARIAFRR